MPRSSEGRKPGATRKIRVLIVTDEMEVGGTQRQIVHIASGLDPERFETTVLYFRNRSFFVDHLEQAGVRVLRVNKRSRLDFGFAWRLLQTVRNGRFDVMHCFAFTGELWGAVIHALLGGGEQPVLLSSVRNTYDCDRWIRRTIKRVVSLRSWRVVANSQVGERFAREKMNLPAGLMSVVYNGVAPQGGTPDAVASIREALRIPSESTFVLFVGRLVEEKDVSTLIRAMGQLRQRGSTARLAIAGDGPLRQQLKLLAASLDLSDSVIFLGQRDDVATLLSAADFVVLPSLVEGLSNVILESMMAGRAVIASRAGGNVELIEHERTGLLFDIGDVSLLAASIQQLTDDRPMRDRLGRSAHDKALNSFTVPAMVGAFEHLYDQAAALRQATGGRIKTNG